MWSRGNGTATITVLDLVVFTGLELLGTLAIIGNLSLIVVLLRNKYLNRASFILMLSLATADVLHGIVTTCFFYPPVILKYQHVTEMGVRLFNIVDWTAWAVTLTHMSAICLDRLTAIMLYGKYNQLVTITRIRKFCIFCWVFFLSTNCCFFFFNFCCLTRPLSEYNYLTFGYPSNSAGLGVLNMYTVMYTPVEMLTICILSISNPITLVQLYRRHKRKVALRMQGSGKTSVGSGLLGGSQRSQWQRASTMLLEMSMKMGSKQINHDVRDLATRRANRQQQRILVQISVVALIFYAYMTAYYISYYVSVLQSTATMIFNSFFYSTTHMINPVIYFSLNKEMREQLREAVRHYSRIVTCRPSPPPGPSRSNTHREHTIDRMQASCTNYSETMPLFSSSSCNYKMTGNTTTLMREEITNRFLDSAENVLRDKISEGVEEEEDESSTKFEESTTLLDESANLTKDSWVDDLGPPSLNKLHDRERSEFMNDLISALKCDNEMDLSEKSSQEELELWQRRRANYNRPSSSLDTPKIINGRFIRISNTLQVISKVPRSGSEDMCLFPSSSTFADFDRRENGLGENGEEVPDPSTTNGTSREHSSGSSSFSESSWKKIGPNTDSASLLPHELADSSDSDDEISYL